MAKSGERRRKECAGEVEVCTEENTDRKVKKKRKKTETEEAPISEPVPEPEQTRTKKKKKKKQVQMAEPSPDPAVPEEGEEEDLSPEERRVLERKMKKIQKKNKPKVEQRTEETADATKTPIAPQQALDYLTCWAEDRAAWRFNKTRQTWLLQNMFHLGKVPDQNFSVLLSYLEGLRGAARDTTVRKAELLVRGEEQKEEKEEEEEEEEEKGGEEDQKKVQRARDVIQLLS